jgi:hypothetical protein
VPVPTTTLASLGTSDLLANGIALSSPQANEKLISDILLNFFGAPILAINSNKVPSAANVGPTGYKTYFNIPI